MKLIFAADDYEENIITRQNDVNHHDVNVLVQINEIGIYYVNFSRGEVFFQEGTLIEDYEGNTVEVEFDENRDLVPHSVCKNAMHHQCMIWKPRTISKEFAPRWKLNADYLDGVIENHNHGNPKIREVYLSAEAPFVGKICGYCEEHSSSDIFPNGEGGKMVAVKVIPIES